MYIAIDETGSFREGKDLEYGIVTLVTITDEEWKKFSIFLDNIFPKGWKNIKGNNIDDDRRKKILKHVSSKNEIKYTSLLFDLSFATDDWVEFHRNGQLQKLEESINDLLSNDGNPSLITEVQLLKRRIRKLSNADYSKFFLIYELYREWLQYYQFDWIYVHQKNDSWTLNHIIDNQSKAGNFKIILKQMLILTTNHLNRDFKVFSPVEMPKDHPFELKNSTIFEGRSAMDGHKVFSNVKVSNEQDDSVLLLPDLIGHTIHKSIKHKSESKWLNMLHILKENRSITMKNKSVKGKNNYYLIRGFNREKQRYEVNKIIQEHHELMSKI